MAVVAFQSAAVVVPRTVNSDTFPRLAALTQRAMQIPAFSSTLPDLKNLQASGLFSADNGV